jgi:dTDP-4-amino-4,6-dideoxygalactose transaminase
MVDLYGQYKDVKDEIDSAIQSVINASAFINGPEVTSFAVELAKYNKINHAVTCGNGTDALQIALMTLDLSSGDEVLLPSFTYVATAEVCALLKLKPVFIDVDYDTFCIDIYKIEENITHKTKAIIPVHLFGQCAEMQSIIELSKEKDLKIVEDTAQAIGAKYTFSNDQVKFAGTMGDIGCLSFFPSKNLGCYGDGGAMLFHKEEMAKKAKMIANHGQRIKYHHDIVGCNSRLDTIQAAILNVKLKHLDEYNVARNLVAEKYNEAFKNFEQVLIPKTSENSTHVYHQYTLRIKDNRRDKMREALQKKGIPSMVYYPIPLHLQKAYYTNESHRKDLPVSEKLSMEVLSLPIHTEMTDEMVSIIIENVIDTIKEVL